MAQPCEVKVSMTYISRPVILSYILKSISCMYIILWDYESVWPEVWPQNKCRSLWPIFYGPVIWPYLMNIIWCMKKSLFGIINQFYSTFDLKVDVGYCDLYFMVQWFCIISWRQFDVWTLYFGIMGQYDMIFDLKINVGLFTCISWPSDFVLYLQHYLMPQCHIFRQWDSATNTLTSKWI